MLRLLFLLVPSPSLPLLLPYSGPPPLSPFPSPLSRTSSTVLKCDQRFYQGYTLQPGDRGEVVLTSPSSTSGASFSSSSLCLWKFFPQQGCRLSLSCPQFNVVSASSTCQGKLITKVGSRAAKQWCGARRPPPLRTRKDMLVGYMALGRTGSMGRDSFRCRITCTARGSVQPVGGSSAPANCKCGQRGGAAARSASPANILSRAFSPSLLFSNTRLNPMSRIVGGAVAPVGSVPWQASLAVSGTNIFCGASLVTDRHLVTAAHCLAGVQAGVLDMVDIVLGEYNTKDSEPGLRRKILRVVIHPQFDEESLRNDLAVVVLQSPVPLTAGTVTPICLPAANRDPQAGSTATVTGFGTTSADSDSPSTRLLTVDVSILSNSACRAKNPVYSGKVVDSMLCASVPQGGKDACKRDSGGPLVAFCMGLQSYPGVYTRVTSFRAWIDQQVKSGRRCKY